MATAILEKYLIGILKPCFCSPMSEDCKETWPLSVDVLHEGIAHRESASDSDFFEVVYSNQSKMKKHCFKCSQFSRDVHDEMYCSQLQLKKYMFMNSNACMLKRQEQVLLDLMNDECMIPSAEEVAMFCWLNPHARFPIAQNSFSGDSDVFSFLPRVLSQSGNGQLASG